MGYSYLILSKTDCGKGEIAHYEQFLLFLQCFQNCLLLMRQKEYLWSKRRVIKLAKEQDANNPISAKKNGKEILC